MKHFYLQIVINQRLGVFDYLFLGNSQTISKTRMESFCSDRWGASSAVAPLNLAWMLHSESWKNDLSAASADTWLQLRKRWIPGAGAGQLGPRPAFVYWKWVQWIQEGSPAVAVDRSMKLMFLLHLGSELSMKRTRWDKSSKVIFSFYLTLFIYK